MVDPLIGLDKLSGAIERITFYNEENGYTVARFIPEGKTFAVTIVGNLMGASVGEALALEGVWTNHPQHGRQFEIKGFTVELPATIEGIRKYLGSGLIKGIGAVTAERIVHKFGLATLDVIEGQIERLREVDGVGEKRVRIIQRGWAEQKQIKQVMIFLQSHGVSTSLAAKIYKEYGDGALHVVRNEPYRLARDIYGIGFLTADKIAHALGMHDDDPARIQAGVSFVLAAFTDEGHVFATHDELIRQSQETLKVDTPLIARAIERLARSGDAIVEAEAIYLAPFYYAELGTANRISQIRANADTRLAEFRDIEWDKLFTWADGRVANALTDKQRAAVRAALTTKISILTGGPGTGKTTTVRALIQILRAKHKSFKLAAPTGRAAKRLSEAAGEPAQTLHRLLEFKPLEGNRFMRDRDNPLDTDLIIVDEVSMIDILLMNALLKAVPDSSHLLLVGDTDQLPSVGAGSVLHDLIASQSVPVTALDAIFRQSETSLIIVNAHRINKGEMPQFTQKAQDFFMFTEPDPKAAAARVIQVVKERIPRKFGLNAIDDIQVLSPMHRGAVGVSELNLLLQDALNPAGQNKKEWRHGARVFRLGDKVLQTRNNYAKQVFNGDLGRVSAFDFEEHRMTVDFEGVRVEYEWGELDELLHAFAMSVHKSQGSEYRAVVIPILTQHYMLLQRNLLYTAVTRARDLVLLVGTHRAIALAVKNNRIAQRNSRLSDRLRKA